MIYKRYMSVMFNVSRGLPTAGDLEMLKDVRERVGLVIRTRWIVLAILATYGIVPYIYYQHSSADIAEILPSTASFPSLPGAS